MSPQLADDLNTLAGQLHAIISPAPPDQTNSLDASEFDKLTTLERKSKRKAPKPPKPPGVQNPFNKQPSLDKLKEEETSVPSPSGKRRAPAAPTMPNKSPSISSTTSEHSIEIHSSISATESVSSGDTSIPNSPVSIGNISSDQSVKVSVERKISNQLNDQETDSEMRLEGKPPPLFIPPPPPHEPPPPPDENSSPVGPLSPHIIDGGRVLSKFSKHVDLFLLTLRVPSRSITTALSRSFKEIYDSYSALRFYVTFT